jgi:RNA polymerase sigma-70 factor (ECF subfamily)
MPALCDESALAGIDSVAMTDAALIERARDGDQRAFADLVSRYHAVCWRYACRMLGDRDDAQDVLQTTFMRVYDGLGRYREDNRFQAWLFRVLINECRMAARSRNRRGKRFIRDPSALMAAAAPASDAAPSDGLGAALNRIDSKLREAVLLKYGEGLGYTEMAELTGVGESALKMRVKRGLEAVRSLMEGGGDG